MLYYYNFWLQAKQCKYHHLLLLTKFLMQWEVKKDDQQDKLKDSQGSVTEGEITTRTWHSELPLRGRYTVLTTSLYWTPSHPTSVKSGTPPGCTGGSATAEYSVQQLHSKVQREQWEHPLGRKWIGLFYQLEISTSCLLLGCSTFIFFFHNACAVVIIRTVFALKRSGRLFRNKTSSIQSRTSCFPPISSMVACIPKAQATPTHSERSGVINFMCKLDKATVPRCYFKNYSGFLFFEGVFRWTLTKREYPS